MLRKILVVDDSTLIRQMYEVFLSRYRGVKLLQAADGAEALETLARDPEIDLVLLDINMPVMNGLELLARLKHQAVLERVPVVVITTDGAQLDAERCLAMGARAHLAKPFKTPSLYAVIERVTGEKAP